MSQPETNPGPYLEGLDTPLREAVRRPRFYLAGLRAFPTAVSFLMVWSLFIDLLPQYLIELVDVWRLVLARVFSWLPFDFTSTQKAWLGLFTTIFIQFYVFSPFAASDREGREIKAPWLTWLIQGFFVFAIPLMFVSVLGNTDKDVGDCFLLAFLGFVMLGLLLQVMINDWWHWLWFHAFAATFVLYDQAAKLIS